MKCCGTVGAGVPRAGCENGDDEADNDGDAAVLGSYFIFFHLLRFHGWSGVRGEMGWELAEEGSRQPPSGTVMDRPLDSA